MKKNITEQVVTVPMTDKDKLLKANSFGCFPKWLKNGLIGDYESKKVFYGKNDKDQTVVFFADFTAKNIVINKIASWSCPQLQETVGTTPEKSSFTPDQQAYIDAMIKSEGVVQKKPSNYETEKGKWVVIDLNTKDSKLFPESGKYLVYKQKGEINVTSPQQDNIINALIAKGFKKDQPAANESDLFVKVSLQTIESGKYKEYFSQPFYMYQPIQNVDLTDLLKDRKTKFDDQKVDAKQCRQSIDILYTAYVKKYKLEDSERIALKSYVQRCSQQINKIFGAQKKLDTLNSLRPNDPSKLSLKMKNENTINLKNLIRESLIETKKTKERNVLSEGKIVKARLSIISENVSLKTKKQKDKFFDELLSEMTYLNSQGFDKKIINEGFWDTLKGLFGHAPDGIMEYFKEYIAKWLVEHLTPMDSNGWLGSIVITAIGNLPIGDIPKLTDCNFLTKLISKSVAEGTVRKLTHEKGLEGPFYDILRNSIVDMLDETSLGSKIEEALGSFICPLLGGVKNKMNVATDTLKQKALATS
jgi:hypothetical protein